MTLCAERGRFLFEIRPDVFGGPMLGDLELALWARWYDDREQRQAEVKGG